MTNRLKTAIRLKGFDFYQRAHPCQAVRQLMAIIDIDKGGLAAYGQMP